MLAVRRIMSRVRRSRMVRDGVEVVNGLPAAANANARTAARRQRPVFGFGGDVGEIERVGEIHERREFGAEGTSGGETLQVEHENPRKFLNGE